MPLTKIAAENFTVFEDIKIPFCEGLNVLVGENGVGKTHIMKLAYAACQASKHDVSFSQKTTMLFRPDQSGIGRLVNRGKSGSNKAMVSVESDTAKIGMTFSTKTRKWDAEINSEEKWEKQMSDLTSVFIPAKEILSNAWNLDAAVKKAEKDLAEVTIADEESDEVCELCGRRMVIKYGPHGRFLACPGFPECRNTKPYFEKIGVACPKCGKDIVMKKTKKGRRYYGCIDNPECDFMVWQKPSGEKCPRCGKLLLEKGNKLVCMDEQCGYVKNKPTEEK